MGSTFTTAFFSRRHLRISVVGDDKFLFLFSFGGRRRINFNHMTHNNYCTALALAWQQPVSILKLKCDYGRIFFYSYLSHPCLLWMSFNSDLFWVFELLWNWDFIGWNVKSVNVKFCLCKISIFFCFLQFKVKKILSFISAMI